MTAGVRIGDIGKVDLEDGKAVVTLELEPKYKGFIRQDATALLRAKTGLKDMFLEVDPGDGKPLPKDGRIPVSNTRRTSTRTSSCRRSTPTRATT